jgi:hypothetical protein
MTDRNDGTPKGARGQTAKRLKLEMPWNDWFDLPPEERAQEESAFLDYICPNHRYDEEKNLFSLLLGIERGPEGI